MSHPSETPRRTCLCEQDKDVVGYLLFVYGAALVGSYACHKREREFRYAYLHKRILKDNKVKNNTPKSEKHEPHPSKDFTEAFP